MCSERSFVFSSTGTTLYEDTGVIEVVSISAYVVDEFIGTIYQAQDFNSVYSVQQTTIVIIWYSSFLSIGGLILVYICYADFADAPERTAAAFPTFTAESNPRAMKKYVLEYVLSTFPAVYTPQKWGWRMWREIVEHHRYMLALDTNSTSFARATNVIQLMTVQIMLMFIVALFYDIESPQNNGYCESQYTERACLSRKGVLRPTKSLCHWNTDALQCEYVKTEISWQVGSWDCDLNMF